MNLRELQQHWDAFGRQDPMWAILTDPARKGRRWTAAEFFATGAEEIAAFMAEATALGLPRHRRRALDFGCGLGRLTQALATHSDSVLGLDVAPSMIEQARVFNQHGARVEYRVQAEPPFTGVADRTVDSSIPAVSCSTSPPSTPGATSPSWPECWRPEASCRSTCRAARSTRRHCPTAPCRRRPIAPRSLSRIREVVPGAGGDVVVLGLRLTNVSDTTWPAGIPLNVGNHWLTAMARWRRPTTSA